jgi:hypothetical protein
MVTRLREIWARGRGTGGSLVIARGLTVGVREVRQIRGRASNTAFIYQVRLVSGIP